jgi:acetyl esterase/lipase
MKKLLLASIYICLSSFIWAQPGYQKSVIQSSAYWLDVDYAGDGIVGHRLDVHLPKTGKAPYPVIIAVYGSAFFSNSSKGNTFQEGLGQKLLENGYAVVSVNHRSSSDGIYPIQIQDIKTAIRFIRSNATNFKLKADKIGITGWSSGGHLSALAGTTGGKTSGRYGSAVVDLTGTTPKYKEHSDAVQAVVDWFGPTDFLIMDSCGSSMNHDEEKSPE